MSVMATLETWLRTALRVPNRPNDAESGNDAIEPQAGFAAASLTPSGFLRVAPFLRTRIDALLKRRPSLQLATVIPSTTREKGRLAALAKEEKDRRTVPCSLGAQSTRPPPTLSSPYLDRFPAAVQRVADREGNSEGKEGIGQ